MTKLIEVIIWHTSVSINEHMQLPSLGDQVRAMRSGDRFLRKKKVLTHPTMRFDNIS